MALLTVALVILIILAIFFSEENGSMSAFAVFVASMMTVLTFGPATVIEFVKGNAMNLIIFALAYAVVGFLFAILKWVLHVRKVKAEFDRVYAEFTSQAVRGVPGKTTDFYHFLHSRGYQPNRDTSFYDESNPIPDISRNKETFMRWMFWWPFNSIFTFFSDPFRWFFESLYEFGHRSLQRIAESAFKDTVNQKG